MDKDALVKRYQAGVRWLDSNESNHHYEKGLRRFEEIEDKLRALGVTEEELNKLVREASIEFAVTELGGTI